MIHRLSLAIVLCTTLVAAGAEVTVQLGDMPDVTSVAAFQRWDMDGNLTKPVNPKAKIDRPEIDAKAIDSGDGTWVFKNLPKGTYDLVVMTSNRTRIEGWQYAPPLEFDPFFPADATVADDVRETIEKDIRGARHYENKVEPLAMGGEDKVVRVLMMLIRDQRTSYEGDMPGAATMRFEIWQYEWRYGGWVKQKRTRVMHRVILHRDELRQWTWLWSPSLGGIEVGADDQVIEFALPEASDEKLVGLRPY